MSRYLLICTDCRDPDTAADVCCRPTGTVPAPSGAPSQLPIVLHRKHDFTASIYQSYSSYLSDYKLSTREGLVQFSELAARSFITQTRRRVHGLHVRRHMRLHAILALCHLSRTKKTTARVPREAAPSAAPLWPP
jgi:hypothetical protein